jgi:hypothetical protein
MQANINQAEKQQREQIVNQFTFDHVRASDGDGRACRRGAGAANAWQTRARRAIAACRTMHHSDDMSTFAIIESIVAERRRNKKDTFTDLQSVAQHLLLRQKLLLQSLFIVHD